MLYGGLFDDSSQNFDVWELTESGLVPGVMARLEVSDAGRLPSQLTVHVTALATSPRTEESGQALSVRAWDFAASRWVTLATSPASTTLGEVSATVSGAEVARYLPGQTLYVLVTAPASSVQGEAVLSVDAIAVSADW
ncbi:MAG TPA: hypothetical protein VGK67_00745 [Myxococcales bacterium]